jgi:hypothetical protein
MEEKPLLYIGIIAVLVVIIIVFGSRERQRTPMEMVADEVEMLKGRCSELCTQEEGSLSFDITLPEDSVTYTTDDAICVRRGRALYCARCCDVVADQEYNATSLSCTLTRTPALLLSCS